VDEFTKSELVTRRASRIAITLQTASEGNTKPSDAVTHPRVSGGYIEEAIPDPISNSEVKLLRADGTAREIRVGE
jgi:predicted Zn-dependent protease